MNRILKLGLLSVIVGALYSCSSDSLYDPDKAGDVKLAQYEAAFVGKYGAIASNQNWGFGGNFHEVLPLIAIRIGTTCCCPSKSPILRK